MLQREIDSLKNLMSKQENKLNQLNVQWNTCNSNNNQLTIVVNQLKQTNINLELKVQQSQTTIINLTKNVQQMTIVNKGNENTLIELKHNYDILLVKFENCQKNVAELTSSNTNLKKKNQEMNITINQLTSSNSELSAKYSALQQSSQTVQLKLSNCERENKILEESLAFEVDKYEKDEKDDVLRELRLQKTTSELKECKVELSSLQKLYISEQANSAKCIDEVVSIKIELKTTITNYETTIYNLNITITKLEFSLQAEVDIKNTYILANEKCELINIDNTKKVELLTQALSDAESQTESCRADLVISISNYQASLITIENQTEQLKGCGSVASTIQLDLAECEAKLDNCSNELTGVTIHLTEVENKNIQLGDENLELADSLQQCDDDRSSLRCTANKGFGTIQESENAIRPILKSFIDTINNLKADRETFETVNDIRCPYT
ncbi:sporulation-specific protein 15-like [Bradysia coprophila]|uniref:sporulation-specific protein 15-like n=1 Tax=Bradysia coprophila TaxID=38358 RepID=UPI00187DA3A4|nr:sporulation-specific protein 15-like [Bradysia coprophila]